MNIVDQAAKALGLETYDTALPQDWVDAFSRNPAVKEAAQRLGVSDYPLGQFVWCYDVARTFGEATPLTPAATKLLAVYNANRSL